MGERVWEGVCGREGECVERVCVRESVVERVSERYCGREWEGECVCGRVRERVCGRGGERVCGRDSVG